MANSETRTCMMRRGYRLPVSQRWEPKSMVWLLTASFSGLLKGCTHWTGYRKPFTKKSTHSLLAFQPLAIIVSTVRHLTLLDAGI